MLADGQLKFSEVVDTRVVGKPITDPRRNLVVVCLTAYADLPATYPFGT